MEGFGKNLLCVSCSFFGESVTLGLSRAMNWEERNWNIYCWRHYMIGFQSFAFFCQGIPRMPALPKFSLALYFKLICFLLSHVFVLHSQYTTHLLGYHPSLYLNDIYSKKKTYFSILDDKMWLLGFPWLVRGMLNMVIYS